MKNKLITDDNSHFISLSDMMSVLMMIFMLIALISMRNSIQKNEVVKEVAIAYQDTQKSLYLDLKNEFEDDLKKWDANINKDTLSITFNSPEILFEKSKSTLKKEFKSILSDFFPRYISIMENKYKDDIEEIRIEGYTDSDGLIRVITKDVITYENIENDSKGITNSIKNAMPVLFNSKDDTNRTVKEVHNKKIEYIKTSKLNSYFYNMKLSQDRARGVLEYCMNLKYSNNKFSWLTDKITANGLSFSKLKYNKDGSENKQQSRRVEFRVKTKADMKIRKIIETLN